jgi:hypothetical protein
MMLGREDMKHLIRLTSLVFIAALLVVALGVRPASADVYVFDTINPYNYTGPQGVGTGSGGLTALAQSFQIDVPGTYLKTIILNLQNNDGSTGTFKVQIWAADGIHPDPNTVLANLAVAPNNDISELGSFDETSFVTFSNVNLSLNVGKYFVVVFPENPNTSSLYWGYDDTPLSGDFSGTGYTTYKDWSNNALFTFWGEGLFEGLPYRMTISAQLPSTAVSSSGLDVRSSGNQSFTARWNTVDEDNLVGFNLYTSATESSPRVKVNPTLIPVKGGLGGNSYEYAVGAIPAGYYWLGEVAADQSETLVGPTAAWRNYFVPLIRH